jgi:DNA-binding NarL/FixJ family response regulator
MRAATSPSIQPTVAAVAVCSADRALCGRLARLVVADASLAVAGVVGDHVALTRVLEKSHIDLALVESPTAEQVLRWTRRHRATAFIVIVGEGYPGAQDMLRSGAQALLLRSADDADIALTVAAAQRRLCVVPHGLLDPSRAAAPMGDDRPVAAGEGPLTSRELEVLVALADGASNKAIARRLGISFHTVKFHVAGILAKLDADSRTEAVTKAAQRGLVML